MKTQATKHTQVEAKTRFNRVDAGINVLFDIHNGTWGQRTPELFVITTSQLGKIYGLRNLSIKRLMTITTEVLQSAGFTSACGNWTVSEFDYNKILFCKIPNDVHFFISDGVHINFLEMPVFQALQFDPNSKRMSHTDHLITQQWDKAEQDSTVTVKKKRAEPMYNFDQGDQKSGAFDYTGLMDQAFPTCPQCKREEEECLCSVECSECGCLPCECLTDKDNVSEDDLNCASCGNAPCTCASRFNDLEGE